MTKKSLRFLMTIIVCTVAITIPLAVAAADPVEINETTFPDSDFRSIVLTNYSDGSGYVDETVTYIDVLSQNISDLKGIEYYPALAYLRCANNQLTSLDISKNTVLEELHCFGNQLASLDVSHNTELKYLYCHSNELSALDVSQCTALIILNSSGNPLNSLDVTNNTKLVELGCYNNQLDSLNISHNLNLEKLSCFYNNLTVLDTTNNTLLTTLACFDNDLESLNLASNPLLKTLQSQDNHLTVIDVSHNPDLWVVDFSKNRLTSLDLSTNLNIALASAANQSPEPLNCYITGTTYWINLTELPSGDLIDFTRVSMTDGGTLDPATGIVTYLSQPSVVTYSYDVRDPEGEAILNVSIGIAALIAEPSADDIHLYTQGDTKWNNVAYDGNSSLYWRGCGIFALSHAAQWLGVEPTDTDEILPPKYAKWTFNGYNTVDGMDVFTRGFISSYGLVGEWSKTANLPWNDVFASHGVSILHVPSKNGHWVLAVGMSLDKTRILVVDSWIGCMYSVGVQAWTYNTVTNEFIALETVNDWNGISSNGTLEGGAQYWIPVSTATSFRDGSNYILPAEINESTFPDSNFRALVLANYSDGDGHPDKDVTFIDVSGQNISSLKGIAYFPNLTELRCYNNQITSLDMSRNTRLVTLNCPDNLLVSLDVSNNPLLKNLYCYENQLTSLNVSNCPNLEYLLCNNNLLSSLNVSNNTELLLLNCGYNALTTLDVSNNTRLTEITCHCNKLTSFDLSKNTSALAAMSPQYPDIFISTYADGSYYVDLNELPNSNLIDWNRVTMDDGGTLDKTTGIVTYPGAPAYVKYYYDPMSAYNVEPIFSVGLMMVQNVAAEETGRDEIGIGNVCAKETFAQGQTIFFTALGAGLNSLPVFGNQRWVPISWQTNPQGTWSAAPYSASFSTIGMSLGEHILSVLFAHEIYDGTDWGRTGRTTTSETTYYISGEIPQTGDQSLPNLWLLLVCVSSVCLISFSLVLFYRHGKKTM